MATFIATFVILMLVVAGMSIGILMGRPAIKGSCGGLNNVGLGGSCSGACSAEEKQECAQRQQHNHQQ